MKIIVVVAMLYCISYVDISETAPSPSFLDGVWVISQGKSFYLWVLGDSEGAERVQRNFLRQAPIVSQLNSMNHALVGEFESAKEIQEIFLHETLVPFVDNTPVIGHGKALIHAALGQHEGAKAVAMAATKTTAAVGGAFFGGPPGAVAGHVGTDVAFTAAESVASGSFKPQGTLEYLANIGDVSKERHFDEWVGLGLVANVGAGTKSSGHGKTIKNTAVGTALASAKSPSKISFRQRISRIKEQGLSGRGAPALARQMRWLDTMEKYYKVSREDLMKIINEEGIALSKYPELKNYELDQIRNPPEIVQSDTPVQVGRFVGGGAIGTVRELVGDNSKLVKEYKYHRDQDEAYMPSRSNSETRADSWDSLPFEGRLAMAYEEATLFRKYYGDDSARVIIHGRNVALEMDKIPGEPLNTIQHFPSDAITHLWKMLEELDQKHIWFRDLHGQNILYDQTTGTFYPIDLSNYSRKHVDAFKVDRSAQYERRETVGSHTDELARNTEGSVDDIRILEVLIRRRQVQPPQQQ